MAITIPMDVYSSIRAQSAQPQGPAKLSDTEYQKLEPADKLWYAKGHDQTQFKGRCPASTAREPRFFPDGFSEERLNAALAKDSTDAAELARMLRLRGR